MAVLALAIGVAWAEGAPAAGGPEKAAKCERGQHPLFGRLAEKLGLSDKQKEDAKAIFQAAREEAKKATDREAKMKIWKDAFEKVKTTVLTDEQRTKLAKMKKGFVGGHLMRLCEKLGLTDKQKEDAKAILKAAHEEAKKATDHAAKMKIWKDAFEKVKTTVLTDEQRAKLKDMREGWREGPGRKGGEDKGASPAPAPAATSGK